MRPFIAAFLTALPLLAQQTATPDAVPSLRNLTGTYRLNQHPDVDGGIDRVIRDLPFFARPAAQARLTSVNRAYRQLVLTQSASQVSIKFDGRPALEVPLAGGRAWTREDGEAFWVTAESAQGRVLQTYRAKDGQRTNEFILTPGGDLLMRVTVRSHKLPNVLKYQVVYHRQA